MPCAEQGLWTQLFQPEFWLLERCIQHRPAGLADFVLLRGQGRYQL